MAKQKKHLPISARLALILAVVGGFLLTGALWMQYNEKVAEREALEKQVAALREENERLNEELSAPWDEEYIKRVARRELGYCLPGEIIYFSNFEE